VTKEQSFSIFLLASQSILKEGVRDVHKAVNQIQTAYLVAQEAFDELFGMVEEQPIKKGDRNEKQNR